MTTIPTTRAEAKAVGAMRYFTGNACSRGHVADRYTTTGQCLECVKAQTGAQVKSGYFKKHYQANRSRLVVKQRKYRAGNSAAVMAASKAWQARNPELTKQYKRKNKHMRRAAIGVFEQPDIDGLLRIQRSQCVGCDASLADEFHVDHIIPLAKGGSNWCGNLQLLCAGCNRKKSSLLPIEWRRRHALSFSMLREATK